MLLVTGEERTQATEALWEKFSERLRSWFAARAPRDEADVEAAVFWFRKAADAGDPTAQMRYAPSWGGYMRVTPRFPKQRWFGSLGVILM